MEVNVQKSITGNNPRLFAKGIFKTWQGIIMKIWYVLKNIKELIGLF
jgi:hypothetical protein